MKTTLKKISAALITAVLLTGSTSTVYCATFTDSPRSVILKTQAEYLQIPLNIRQKFESSGWTIKYTDANTMSAIYQADTGVTFPAGSYVMGLTRTSDSSIYINSDLLSDHSNISHEMGHWIDISAGHAYINSPEWQQIFLEEGRNFSEYGSSNRNEFFGEICSEVMQGRGVATCPKATAYVKNIVDS